MKNLRIDQTNYYELFFEFIETFLPGGFLNINSEDPLVKKINAMMIRNKQHFHIADLMDLRILYVSDAIEQDLGIQPAEYTPKTELELQHPDDLGRFTTVRSKFIKLCTETFSKDCEYALMTTNTRFRHAKGSYTNFLLQGYVFTQTKPGTSVYGLVIMTDIDWYGPIRHGYNFYVGKDMSYFRLPDKELIETGNIFTDREFGILDILRQGFDSTTIGKKLFISSHTVDTHRRNILKKTGHRNTAELIIELQERGFF